MNRGDQFVERGSDRLRNLAEKAAARGGTIARLADPLAEDASFLRKLKPSLIAARARKENLPAGDEIRLVSPRRPKAGARDDEDGMNPFAVIGGAAAAGIVTAKLLDWRGHAHPRG